MARKDRFPTERLHEIADEVVSIFRDEERVPTEEIVILGDGVPMWGLGLTGLWMPLARLQEPGAYFLERWMHPIRCYGRVVAHAETTFVDGSDELYVPTIAFGESLPPILDRLKESRPSAVVRAIVEPTMGDLCAAWVWDEDPVASEVHVVDVRSEMGIGETDFIRWVRTRGLLTPRIPEGPAN